MARSAMRAAERPPGSLFSMPAAELFATYAVADVPIRDMANSGEPVTAVVAVGDCMPAARVISAARARVPLMHGIMGHMRNNTEQWLGVHVPRELNTDPDLLSHPSSAHRVVEALKSSGVAVAESGAHPEAWLKLSQLLASPRPDVSL